MTPSPHPALALVGRWRLTRRIEDFRAGAEARFDGEAALIRTGEAADLRWQEAGILRMAGAETRAARVYLWRLAPPDRVEVAYEDGRYFHDFAFVPGGGAEIDHDCPPDLYHGVYGFEGPDRWRLTWRVRGPRKDYRMVTEHARIA